MTDAATATVAYSVKAGVATIILDRPEASNALNLAMKAELLQALTAARADASVRAVAITAAGKNFCVGQDLGEHVKALRADPAHAMDTVRDHYNPIIEALHAIEVPVVVGINGACVGAGFGVARFDVVATFVRAHIDRFKAQPPLFSHDASHGELFNSPPCKRISVGRSASQLSDQPNRDDDAAAHNYRRQSRYLTLFFQFTHAVFQPRSQLVGPSAGEDGIQTRIHSPGLLLFLEV